MLHVYSVLKSVRMATVKFRGNAVPIHGFCKYEGLLCVCEGIRVPGPNGDHGTHSVHSLHPLALDHPIISNPRPDVLRMASGPAAQYDHTTTLHHPQCRSWLCHAISGYPLAPSRDPGVPVPSVVQAGVADD